MRLSALCIDLVLLQQYHQLLAAASAAVLFTQSQTARCITSTEQLTLPA